jgi:hypothetical protein
MNSQMNSQVIERDMLPQVVINLLTKNRTDLAVWTIHQCLRHLKYDGELKWFISDNGSAPEHLNRLYEVLPHRYFLGGHVNKGTIGECWNRGLEDIFKRTDFYIRLEDDMQLKADLDITRYVKMMMVYSEIGMIRLGQMVNGLDFESNKFKIYTHIGFEEDVMLRVGKHYPYCFSGHPALIHKRFHDMYGYYAEEKISAGELEVAMDEKVRGNYGPPKIYFPWDLGRFGTWGAWDHKGVIKAE